MNGGFHGRRSGALRHKDAAGRLVGSQACADADEDDDEGEADEEDPEGMQASGPEVRRALKQFPEGGRGDLACDCEGGMGTGARGGVGMGSAIVGFTNCTFVQ